MNGAPAPVAAPAPPVRYRVRPRLRWIGIALLLLFVPLSLALSIAAGFYVPVIGYVDPAAVGIWMALGLGMIIAGIALVQGARLPLRIPRPPFPAINPPSIYTSSTPTPMWAKDGVPLLYTETEATPSAPPTGTVGSGYSTMGFRVRSVRCPRCGWTGTVHPLTCPRCGLRL